MDTGDTAKQVPNPFETIIDDVRQQTEGLEDLELLDEIEGEPAGGGHPTVPFPYGPQPDLHTNWP